MAPEMQRLEDAARIAMGGFDDAYSIAGPAAGTTMSDWFVRTGYAVGFAGLIGILLLAAV